MAFGIIIITWQYLNPESIEKLAESQRSEGQTRSSNIKLDVSGLGTGSGHNDSFENSARTARIGSQTKSNRYKKSKYAGEVNPLFEENTEC